MVSEQDRAIRAAVEGAFQPAFQSLAAQRRQFRSRLQQARQQSLSEQERIRQFQQRLGSQEFLRSLGIEGAAQRADFVSRLSGAEQQLVERLENLSQTEIQTLGQFRAIEQQLLDQRTLAEQRAFQDISGAEFRAGSRTIASIEQELGQSLPLEIRQSILQQLEIPGGQITIPGLQQEQLFTPLPGGQFQLQTIAPQQLDLIQRQALVAQPEQLFTALPPTPTGITPRERLELQSLPLGIREIGLSPFERAQLGAREFFPLILGGEPGFRPLGLPEEFFTFPQQRPGSFPAQVRESVIGGVSQVAQAFGVPPRGAEIIGGLALSLGLAPGFGFGTAGQVEMVAGRAVIRRGGLLIDVETGQVLGSARGVLSELQQRLRSSVTAGQKAELREITKDLIKRAKDNPNQLKSLRELYRRERRSDLFDDIFAQEVGQPSSFGPRQPTQLPPAVPAIDQARPQILGLGGPIVTAPPRGAVFEREDLIGFRFPKEARVPSLSGATLNILGSASISLTGLRPAQRSRQLLLTQQLTRETQLQRLAQPQLQIQRQLGRQVQRERLAQRLGLAILTGQALTQQQRQTLRQRLIEDLAPRPRPPRPTPRLKPTVLLPFVPLTDPIEFGRKLRKLKKQAKAFDVLVRRKGKFKKIADDLPFNRALKRGRDETLNTLAAEFKVVPDKKAKPKKKDIKFKPSPQNFRDFRIKGGKKISLPPGHLIERKTKRITSPGEIKEILKFQSAARKARGGKRSKRGRRRDPFGL